MSGSAGLISATVASGFISYRDAFDALTAQAPGYFAAREWAALQEGAAARLELYNTHVAAVTDEIAAFLGEEVGDLAVWESARDHYRDRVTDRADVEIGKTFFSSVTRRVLQTEGTNPRVEFTDDAQDHVSGEPELLRLAEGTTEEKLATLMLSAVPAAKWQNLERDVRLAALEMQRRFSSHGEEAAVTEIEAYPQPFFRGRAAYVIGTIVAGEVSLPLAVAVHHTTRGLIVGAVLMEPDDISVLCSYTRSSFVVVGLSPGQRVN